MKFDFNEIIERSGKDAIAIDGIGKSPTGRKTQTSFIWLL